MPWQQYVADVAGELGPGGRLWYRKVIITVPRQSGKTTLTLAEMVDRCVAFDPPQRVVYAAQTRNDARHKWEDEHVRLLRASVFRKRFTVRLQNGSEAIRWKNGSMHELIATQRRSGHGKTIDLAVLDEAFAQVDSRVEQSAQPAMITRPEPQLWVVSTAGDETSLYLSEQVRLGRASIEAEDPASRICYFEWSAADGADVAEILSTLSEFHPAIGLTIPAEAIISDAESMSLDDVRRAYGNLWTRRDNVIDPLPGWAACEARSSVINPVALAVDVAPGQLSAAIAAAGVGADGVLHVELVDHQMGTGWLVPRLAQIVERHKPVSISVAPSAPAGALLPAFKSLGLPITEIAPGDVVKACGGLLDDVQNGVVRHPGQSALNIAVDGAVRKPYGDGGWMWSRKTSSVDITPLVAVTLARWGWRTQTATGQAWGAWA